jgi:plastocyanin
MKFLLIIVLAFALLGPSTVFAQSQGMAVTATADQGSKIISVTGQTVSDITDVTFRVTSPSGNNVVAVAQVTPDSGGEFETMIEVGATWTEDGFYTIEAMQGTQNSLYVLELLVEITNGTTEETSVTESNLETGIYTPIEPNVTSNSIEIKIPSGASDPDAPYFWVQSTTGITTGDVTIPQGDLITWHNGDSAFHTVTSVTSSGELDGVFDSGFFTVGKSYTRQFDDVGVFHYFCSLHPWMTGIVTVEGDEPIPTSAPEPTKKIPDWVKNIFGWYAQDQISEEEIINALQYLISEGTLKVD